MVEGPDPLFHSLGSEGEGKCLATVDVCMLFLIVDDHISHLTGVVCFDGLVVYCHQLGDAVLGRGGRRSRSVARPGSIFVGLFQHWSFLRVLMRGMFGT